MRGKILLGGKHVSIMAKLQKSNVILSTLISISAEQNKKKNSK